jgi:hypothetical protein
MDNQGELGDELGDELGTSWGAGGELGDGSWGTGAGGSWGELGDKRDVSPFFSVSHSSACGARELTHKLFN